MLNWPDWNKLYANWQCLYFWVPFSDEQWQALDNAANESDKNDLVRKFREEYLKDRDIVTGELKKPAETEVKEKAESDEDRVSESTAEESIEDVKPVKKAKKGK